MQKSLSTQIGNWVRAKRPPTASGEAINDQNSANAPLQAQVTDTRAQLDKLTEFLFAGLDENSRSNSLNFERLFRRHGTFKSTAALTERHKRDAYIHFQHRDKALCSLAVATTWFGGDYFEFGARDMNTFVDMLVAFDIARLQDKCPDTRFYGFDIFGDPTFKDPAKAAEIEEFERNTGYFAKMSSQGDIYERALQIIKRNELFVDKCSLVKGYFQETLSASFKATLKKEGRSIGYAFLDCNFAQQYKVVFEFIADLMKDNSYIYMDEYFSVPGVAAYFDQFLQHLAERRGMRGRYMRHAGGFGALFRLSKVGDLPPLNF